MRFEVRAGLEDRELVVEMRTDGDPMTDESFYWAPYRILRAVDALVAPIGTIEGAPRDAWAPFRGFTPGSIGGATTDEP